MGYYDEARDVRSELGWRNGLRNIWRRSRTFILIAGVSYLSYQCGRTEGMETALSAQASNIEKMVSSYDGTHNADASNK